MTRIVGIVPMKGHSSRVPRKNLRPLCGRPLYQWITEALLGAKKIDETVIETDSDEIEADVKASFPGLRVLRRPENLVGDDVPMNLLIEFHMSQLEADIFLQTHSTNPLLKPETIDKAIDAYAARDKRYDSLFAVNVWRTRFFWEDGKPVNHNPDELIPTQDLPPLLEENSNIYIFTRDSFALRNHRIGKTPMMFPMEYLEAVDIDELSHFELAEALMERRLRTAGKTP